MRLLGRGQSCNARMEVDQKERKMLAASVHEVRVGLVRDAANINEHSCVGRFGCCCEIDGILGRVARFNVH